MIDWYLAGVTEWRRRQKARVRRKANKARRLREALKNDVNN